MGVNEYIQIGNVIKKLRKKRKITAKQAAMELGINYSTYSNYENGNREPKLEILQKIAEYYKIPLNDMIGYDKEPDYKLRPPKAISLTKTETINHLSNQLISENDLFNKWLLLNDIKLEHSLLNKYIFTFEDESIYELTHTQFNQIKELNIEQVKALIRSFDKLNKESKDPDPE